MDATVFLRFDEDVSDQRPRDAAGNLSDLDVDAAATLTLPTLVDGACGKARQFGAALGLLATDLVPGSTLHTGDVSVQVILSWDLAAQAAAGVPGTIIARGKTGSVAEYIAYGLELRVVNATNLIGELRWLWQDIAGTLKTQIGGHFQAAASGFLMLTATRRWVSPTSAILRYYLADEMLSEVETVDGSIGGGTTGLMQLGTRWTGAAFANNLRGAIDELRVVPRELAPQEIEATWNRIAVLQPLATRTFIDLHDQGFPLALDPSSRPQREARLHGAALGLAAGNIENMRRNLMPDRAYDPVLGQWEGIARVQRRPSDSLEQRQARVVARTAQRQGSSIPGLEAMLAELVDTDVDNLEFLAYDQQITDNFATLEPLRWTTDPAVWSIVAGKLSATFGVGSFVFDDATRAWATARTSIGGEGRGAHILTGLTFVTPFHSARCGVFLGDSAVGDWVLLELRDLGGVFAVVTEVFRGHFSVGTVVHATLGGNPANLWLHLWQHDSASSDEFAAATDRTYSAAWSTTSGTSGFTISADIVGPVRTYWAGHHLRTTGAIGGARADFDSTTVFAPYGDRPFYHYVYRNPALPGRPDLLAAHDVIQTIKHSHTRGTIITSKDALYNDPSTGYNRGPMGGGL